ncbi:MAG: CTP synthase (glutamine hydrolyzing) [Nanoarchaeota archaeon]
MPPKIIVFTGGVLSGLGKGIAAASTGFLLGDKYKIVPIKCDGYLNVDPGTMNPIEHGEVFVLEDGGEVDMDFGHYERFLNIHCKFEWNLTMGKVFERVREKERRGDYLGKTVQLIPHVTDLIKQWFLKIGEDEKADILLIEIGGTVGDMENQLYIEAVRQLEEDIGSDNIFYVHLTYIPIPYGTQEQKSKPTQQSVGLLRSLGIQPDMIIGRCSEPIDDTIKTKIALFASIGKKNVISGVDTDNVYKIPLMFEKEGVGRIIAEHFKLNRNLAKLAEWKRLIEEYENADKTLTIAMAGKYTKLNDSYASVNEALMHAGAHHGTKVKIKWVETTDEKKVGEKLVNVDGVIVPGGFGERGVEGKINAIRHCRENSIPFLGLCYGLQMAVIEHARHVCKLEGANTTENAPDTPYPVIDILPEQKEVTKKGGTMRLGAYPAILKKGTLVHELYKSDTASERHRHRYEVNPTFHKQLEIHDLVFSGMSPDRRLVEFIEKKNHPYFVGTQAHPELKSTLLKPAPLFLGLVKAALEK